MHRYFRGQIRETCDDRRTDSRARDSHFDLYSKARRTALELWLDTANVRHSISTDANSPDREGKGLVRCLLWYSNCWYCAVTSFCSPPKMAGLKVGSHTCMQSPGCCPVRRVDTRRPKTAKEFSMRLLQVNRKSLRYSLGRSSHTAPNWSGHVLVFI